MDAVTPRRVPDRFEALFARDPDPWGTRTRWYEARKRHVLMAALPHERYARAYEPGCGNGELTAALAARCDEVAASDASPAALDHARRRLCAWPNARLCRLVTPAEWPDGAFDLVVVSELGYYLEEPDLRELARRCARSLAASGVVAACHWRHSASDFLRGGDAVHRLLALHLGLPCAVRHVERDFVLDVWCRDTASVAQREGLA